jgi:hypothetical protein
MGGFLSLFGKAKKGVLLYTPDVGVGGIFFCLGRRLPEDEKWGFAIHFADSATSKMRFCYTRKPYTPLCIYTALLREVFGKAKNDELLYMAASLSSGLTHENPLP